LGWAWGSGARAHVNLGLGVLCPCRHAGEHLPPAASHAPRRLPPTAPRARARDTRPQSRKALSKPAQILAQAQAIAEPRRAALRGALRANSPEIQVLDQSNTRLIQVLARLG
jgi:hypothetical protein